MSNPEETGGGVLCVNRLGRDGNDDYTADDGCKAATIGRAFPEEARLHIASAAAGRGFAI